FRPAKRSAAGQDIRHGTPGIAGWRLAPYPDYRILSQAHTPQARQAQRDLAVSFAGQLALVLLP
ncbi:TPA: hypothetical protein ACQ98X_005322, partial [Klebsiella variicola]